MSAWTSSTLHSGQPDVILPRLLTYISRAYKTRQTWLVFFTFTPGTLSDSLHDHVCFIYVLASPDQRSFLSELFSPSSFSSQSFTQFVLSSPPHRTYPPQLARQRDVGYPVTTERVPQLRVDLFSTVIAWCRWASHFILFSLSLIGYTS